ncbi:hypothetical protein IX308_000569 [Porphyromonas levii]|uniref:hypothetical protein n=1 Tax=Porphyromonas levii TaxID=28114 RepID=UPI001BA77084|nr:hypothetical protein [Porphyromonas levii]MBR8784398.1 hypothetical protein [Porphyromonas levii]
MYRLLPFLAIILLLPGCQLLQQAKGINQRHYAAGELQRITQELQAQEPSFEVPSTLYLTDDYGKYTEELEKLLNITTTSQPMGAKIALLMGNGEALLRSTSDTILLANAHLLMGNIVEADRLMGLSATRDLATEAIIHIRQERMDEGIALLEKLIRQSANADVQLRAARLMSLLGKGGWDYLMRQSSSEWERFMAATRLGNRTASTPREVAYVSYVSAMQQPDSLRTKEATQQLLAQPTAPWRQYALLQLIPNVIAEKLWIELYRVAKELPEMAKSYPIYYQVLEFEKEVELLARYEAPETPTQNTMPIAPREGSFRAVWGNVTNVDNWVMERSDRLSTPTLTVRPTAEQYRHIYQLISRTLQSFPPSP